NDGKVYVYGQHGNQAVEINTKDGSTNIRQFTHGDKDSIIINPNTVLGRDPQNVMEMIGREAVQNINNPQPARPGDDSADPAWPRHRHRFPKDRSDRTGTKPDYPIDLPPIPLPKVREEPIGLPPVPMPKVREEPIGLPPIPMPKVRDEPKDETPPWRRRNHW